MQHSRPASLGPTGQAHGQSAQRFVGERRQMVAQDDDERRVRPPSEMLDQRPYRLIGHPQRIDVFLDLPPTVGGSEIEHIESRLRIRPEVIRRVRRGRKGKCENGCPA
jgi:hypothetical protein